MADIPPLPPGFKLDAAPAGGGGTVPPLPPGFKLDAPAAAAPAAAPKEPGLLDKAAGWGEAALTGLSTIPAAVEGAAAGLGGLAAQVVSGDLGKPGAAQRVQEGITDRMGKRIYQPRTESGQEAVKTAGQVFDKSKLGGLGPSEAIALGGRPRAGSVARAATGAKIETALGDLNERLRSAAAKIRPGKEMGGGGAAETEAGTLRRERAAQLPVPVKLTKGQAERTFEQQQFERETAKNPDAGKRLRDHYAEQNQQILQNFDAWIDQTGAQAGSLRATGEAVTQAVADKAKRAKGQINAEYEKARKSGEMAEMVPVAPLAQYLQGLQPESINAGVIQAAGQKLNQLAKGGAASINDLEEIRKMVGNLGNKDAPNAHFAGEIKKQIDALTEGRGGEAYKRARALHREYVSEFKNVGAVDKLLKNKPGTKDRAVAFEDVFQHSVLRGSLDDLRQIRKTLQTGGGKGEQAWKELQGATVRHLKDEITKSVAPDINGNPVVSPAKLNQLVTALDSDGKLDVLFGKKGAAQLREVNELAKDVYTAPPGSVNHSNTASIIIGLMDTIVSGTSGMPLPIGSAVNYGVRQVKRRSLDKRVGQALEQPLSFRDVDPQSQAPWNIGQP